LIPFSFARVLQFSAMSARLFELTLTSGDNERLRRLRPIAEAGVAKLDPFEEEEKDLRLRGVYGVDKVVAGVYGGLVLEIRCDCAIR